jgi:hypothetical protein
MLVKILFELTFAAVVAALLTVVAFVVFPIEVIEELGGVKGASVWVGVWVAFTTLGLRFTLCTYINDWRT